MTWMPPLTGIPSENIQVRGICVTENEMEGGGGGGYGTFQISVPVAKNMQSNLNSLVTL